MQGTARERRAPRISSSMISPSGPVIRTAWENGRAVRHAAQTVNNCLANGNLRVDDGSMSSISAEGNALRFTPGSEEAYFYETFPCTTASSEGYDAISFSLQGPEDGLVILEIQTKSSCSDEEYTSVEIEVDELTGSLTLPLDSWSGANGDAITALVWKGFSDTDAEWELGPIEFVCADPVDEPGKT